MDASLELLRLYWAPAVSALHVVAALAASGHALLSKRESGSTVAWLGLIWLSPGLGAVLYLLLGVNRIRREARSLRQQAPPLLPSVIQPTALDAVQDLAVPPEQLPSTSLRQLAGSVSKLTRRALFGGNEILPFWDGDSAYDAMIDAIDRAESTVALCTYIFDDDAAGRRFAGALAGARARGVEVRVLIDAAGVRYSRRPMDLHLRRLGVPARRFLRTIAPWRVQFFNLRNHRKILVVDGRVAFTGGMNVRAGHAASTASARDRVVDEHFRVVGPVASQLMRVFAIDWAFTTGEALEGDAWFPVPRAAGSVVARAIADGPDSDFEKFLGVVHGALACAQQEVLVSTPYFLPDASLLRALATTAARGVDVQVLVPQKTNVPMVQWASRPLQVDAARRGCSVSLVPSPFAHSKLIVVDRAWMLMGSANWDPRSYRLNFEVVVEIYDPDLAGACADRLGARIASAQPLDADGAGRQSLTARLLGALAGLASPYL